MYDNPFTAPLNKMEALNNAHATRMAALTAEINWYQGYQPDKVRARISVLAQTLAETDRKLQRIDQQIASLNITQRATDAEARFGLDPRRWLSPDRKAARLKLENVKKQLATLARERVSIATPKTQAGHDIRELHAFHVKKLNAYRDFDVPRAASEINKLGRELSALAPELQQLRKRKSSLDSVLAEKFEELEPHLTHLGQLESAMQKAEYFYEQLNAPRANKAEIHQRCEAELGDGSPGRVKSKLRPQIEKEKRVIGKLKTVIEQAIRRSQSDIREVIIDGNNMAYRAGSNKNQFIGMAALDAIVPLLKAEYKVTINYDPKFNRRLGLSAAALRNRYPGVDAEIVPEGTNADYYLLKFAADRPHAYVISNDNFDEYSTEPAVRENRILKHAIVNGCISIPFLQIQAAIG
jgi:hypothetical protein